MFDVVETTISRIHAAMREGSVTARQLVETYFERMARYDKSGPELNAIISRNSAALSEADALDQKFREHGPVGPLHGIPLVIKDQCDVAGMPTTMGSVLFRDYMPTQDAFVVEKLRKAGAIIIAKSTLGELGAGDTHGSLFGSTKNVYDTSRTAGGSSGGSGVAASANFCAVALGQEGFASIRRPATWNGIAGMRPTAGLVSRSGVYGGWPTINGSLGPMARTVSDLAAVLDCMVGYDKDDPLTALGASHIASSYSAGLNAQALKGARLGILRDAHGFATDPSSDDFAKIDEVFGRAVEELRQAGATVIDPIVIPDLVKLLATRARSEAEDDEAFAHYLSRSPNSPFKTREQARSSDLYGSISRGAKARWSVVHKPERHHEYLKARDLLMIRLNQVMVEHELDAIVHKAVEHQPTLIAEGVNPPYRDQTGAIHINTFLVFVPSVVVPCGFTRDGLPAGITFLGRPYDDAAMLNYAYAYEQQTHHRTAPPLVP